MYNDENGLWRAYGVGEDGKRSGSNVRPISTRSGSSSSLPFNVRPTTTRSKGKFRERGVLQRLRWQLGLWLRYRPRGMNGWIGLGLLATVTVLLFAELIWIIVGSLILYTTPAPILVPLELFPKVPYKHLPPPSMYTLQEGTSIFHVAKEFGPAAMGGLGMVLTALAVTQQKSNQMNVSVIMPYYTYLKSVVGEERMEKIADLSMNVRSWRGHDQTLNFSVWRFQYYVGLNTAELAKLQDMYKQGHRIQGAISFDLPPEQIIPVYLIGPGDRSPFERAFRANDILQIYSSPSGLPQEWKDLFFCKATALFIDYLVTQRGSSASPMTPSLPTVDVVHLHGATNAYVAQYLYDFATTSIPSHQPPSIVYTMHDYLDELQYSNTVDNVLKFMSNDANEQSAQVQRYIHGHRMYMSALALDLADMVTFVSRTMAEQMVTGELDFYLKEFIMPSLLRRAQRGEFVGVTNGVDFAKLNPFSNQMMRDQGCAFPDYALRSVEGTVGVGDIVATAGSHSDTLPLKPFLLSNDYRDYITTAKESAKRYLIQHHMLVERDLARPVVLFVGRFQYNKGLEFFKSTLETFREHDAKLVAIGQKNNYPFEWIQQLEREYSDHFKLVATQKEQQKWSVFYRAAADFTFVPSLTESFGLVAAEGLLFGAGVISSGVGGLREFLVDRPLDD
ncbi:hypothetical protein BZG36_05411, partial [Bifiguratus adelaidae]